MDAPVLLEQDLLSRRDQARLGVGGRVEDLSGVLVRRSHDDEAAIESRSAFRQSYNVQGARRRCRWLSRQAGGPLGCLFFCLPSEGRAPCRFNLPTTEQKNVHVEDTGYAELSEVPSSLVVLDRGLHRVEELANDRDRPCWPWQVALFRPVSDLSTKHKDTTCQQGAERADLLRVKGQGRTCSAMRRVTTRARTDPPSVRASHAVGWAESSREDADEDALTAYWAEAIAGT